MSANSSDAPKSSRPRIQTQIHRRKKAKVLSALEPEWEATQSPPLHLRMPPKMMSHLEQQSRPSRINRATE